MQRYIGGIPFACLCLAKINHSRPARQQGSRQPVVLSKAD